MDTYYNNIAEIVLAACPENITRCWISAEVKDDWSEQEVWYENGNGKFQPDIESIAISKIADKLRAIRAQMTIPGQAPWSRCTFTLFPDGKFKFDVEYDN
jgi:hypothetical protein